MKGVDVEGVQMSPAPVNLSTGNFVYDHQDLEIGGSIPLIFHRYYNARDYRTGVLGRCFVHNYEVSLQKTGAHKISVLRSDGQVIYFEQDKEGHYQNRSITLETLKQEKEGYVLTGISGDTIRFDLEGRMLRQEDGNGRGVTFTYGEDGKLKEARNDYGQFLCYTYEEGTGYLTRVTDHTGRGVELFYEKDLLSRVRIPGNREYTYTYGSQDRILEVHNPAGLASVKNTYDPQCRVLSQTFPDGSAMTFSYEDARRRVTMRERNESKTIHVHDDRYRNIETIYEDGTSEQFIYNHKNQCICMTGRSGHTKRMAYDNRGNLIQILDVLKRKVNFTYDGGNRLLRVRINGKKVLSNDYDAKGNLIRSENAFGEGYTLINDRQGRPTERIYGDGSRERLTYDERGNISSITNPLGGETRYFYDALNRVTRVTDALGRENTFVYNEAGYILRETNALGLSREYTYEAGGKLAEIKNYNGTITGRRYNCLGKPEVLVDEQGRETHMKYDAMWNVSRVTRPNGGSTEYVYDRENRLSRVIDALGQETRYEYDCEGNCTGEINAKGERTDFVYDPVGRLIEVVNAEGGRTSYTYDDRDHLTSITDSMGHRVELSYDEAGQLVREESDTGEKRFYTYTSLGDVETVTNERGNTIRYTYAPGGKHISRIEYPDGTTETYTYDVKGNVTARTDILGNRVTYTYDELDRVIRMEDGEGAVKEYTYDAIGNLLSVRDALGNETTYEYTPGGELLKTTDALGNQALYAYDDNGQLCQVIQKGSTPKEPDRVTTYERDLLGQVCKVTDALGQQEHYAYDAIGQLVEHIDKEGYLTRYGYTKLGDVNHIRYDDGREVRLSYNALRHLEEMEDWLGTTRIENDALGRALRVTDPQGRVVSYTYGPSGERTSLTYPDGREVTYGYDAYLRLTSLKEGEQMIHYAYNAQGNLSEKCFPNGTATRYEYDKKGQLTGLIHSDREGILDAYTYRYDPLGNKIGITKQRRSLAEESGSYAYSYDPLGRLSSVTRDGVLQKTYTYDAFGNRIGETERGREVRYTYNALNQLLTRVDEEGAEAYTYDKRGNLIQIQKGEDVTYRYRYGALNRLEEARNKVGERSIYQYNGLEHRVSKTIQTLSPNPEQEIRYTLDLTRQYHNLLQKEEKNRKQTFLWDRNVTGMLEGDGSASDYYLQDDLGSPIRLLNAEGSQTEVYGYDEFGRDLYGNQGEAQPFGYTGYQHDRVAGTYYAQAREYLPGVGRFAGQDVVKGDIMLPFTMNQYTYCFNNSMVLVDLDGAWPEWSEIGETIIKGWNILKEKYYGVNLITHERQVCGDVNYQESGHIGNSLFTNAYAISNKTANSGRVATWAMNVSIPVPFTEVSSILNLSGASLDMSSWKIKVAARCKAENDEFNRYGEIGFLVDKGGINTYSKYGGSLSEDSVSLPEVPAGLNLSKEELEALSYSYAYTKQYDFATWRQVAEAMGVVGAAALLMIVILDDSIGIGVADNGAIPILTAYINQAQGVLDQMALQLQRYIPQVQGFMQQIGQGSCLG